jgi:endonuclease G
VLVLVLGFTACNYEDDAWSPYTSKAEIDYSLTWFKPTTISGSTVGDPNYTWTIKVTEGKEFCTAVTSSGSVGQGFKLKLDENNTGKDRFAEVVVTYNSGYTKTFELQQLAKTENPDYDRPWAEQPKHLTSGNYIYKTYYTTLSGNRSARNYSICYDTDKLVPHWVAYPVHRSYIGSLSRTNRWSFDDWYYSSSGAATYRPTEPVIPEAKQQNIKSGSYGTGDQRGHMLPSATRLSDYNTNAQTFYATNMMPQHGKFNEGVWANLEGDVRSKMCADTLFVVTGTLFESGSYQFESRGRKITRPTHAYKLLLRTKSGNTGKHIVNITSADELMCIGFLFENSSTGANTSISQAVVSVAEIERRSGFKFFRNLNPAIADEVKAQKDFKAWGF